MPKFEISNSDIEGIEVGGKIVNFLKKEIYDQFNAKILGLGNLKLASVSIDTVAAVFDLQGFTNFCKQIDPHLSVPVFLSTFLDWLLQQIKSEMTNAAHDLREEGVAVWAPLPFFVKFMGDGLLLLWNSGQTTPPSRRNIVVSLSNICNRYAEQFVPSMQSRVSDCPPILRCGVARGAVFSVGDGTDFVGPCINVAARLQKLDGLTFAFTRRGFEIDDSSASEFFTKRLLVVEVEIRGIGAAELVCIKKSEYDSLTEPQKQAYKIR